MVQWTRAGETICFSIPPAGVEFKPERRQNPEWYHMLGRRETTIAGEPAVIVDYTVKVPERIEPFSAREAYVVHNSHLFTCTFIGLRRFVTHFIS